MSTPQASDQILPWLQERLTDYAMQFGVVGASVAVLHGGAIAEAATGSLNLATGVAATSDSLFQIGSISKTYTTTLVLQLVERGLLGIDDTIRMHLPHFRLASEEVSERVTLRQLLAHTSGIDGEFFTDTGTDSDCIEAYVRACSNLGQIHPPGESTSYCNAAFVILGSMAQQVTGRSWDSVLHERLLSPLRLQRTTTDYAELPRFRVAVGHMKDPVSKRYVTAARLHLPRGMGPSGATLHASAGDVAKFGSMLLHAGRAPNGASILSSETISQALEPQADWPSTKWTQMRSGLGWQIYSWSNRQVFGHDGVTLGQASYLRVMPDADLAVALLTTGGTARNLYEALFADIFHRIAGVALPAPPAASITASSDQSLVLGSYANRLTRADIFIKGGKLQLKTSMRQLADVLPDQVWPLTPIDEGAYRVEEPELRIPDILVLHHFDRDGRARYVSLRNRDLARLS
jgi:CubicO group peptidase (beta-lactamase class C family)